MAWRRMTLAVAGVATLLAATGSAAPVVPPADEVAVRKVVDTFVGTLNNADLDTLSAMFTPDATVFFPLAPVLGLLDGKPEIVKVFGIFFESVRKDASGPPYMDLKPEGLKIRLYGATAVATFQFSGKTMFSRRTLVLHREGGKWMIIHMHASGLPLQEP